MNPIEFETREHRGGIEWTVEQRTRGVFKLLRAIIDGIASPFSKAAFELATITPEGLLVERKHNLERLRGEFGYAGPLPTIDDEASAAPAAPAA